MRLERFLIHERKEYDNISPRTKELDLRTFYELLGKNCKRSVKAQLDGKGTIYRGFDKEGKYFLGDGRGHKRVSRNTSNFYTLWIDNDKKWDFYPKRSQSFICSSGNYGYASSFGETYYVFPYDNVKIGVCPSTDFWGAIHYSVDSYIDASDFNSYLEMLLDDVLGQGSYDTDYKTMMNALKKADKMLEQNERLIWDTIDSQMPSYVLDSKMFDMLREKNSFVKLMQTAIDPHNMKMDLLKAGDSLPYDREVWMEGPVLFLHEREYSQALLMGAIGI